VSELYNPHYLFLETAAQAIHHIDKDYFQLYLRRLDDDRQVLLRNAFDPEKLYLKKFDKINFLKSLPILKEVFYEELLQLEPFFELRQYQEDDIVFNLEGYVDHFLIIYSGSVNILEENSLLNNYTTGDFINLNNLNIHTKNVYLKFTEQTILFKVFGDLLEDILYKSRFNNVPGRVENVHQKFLVS